MQTPLGPVRLETLLAHREWVRRVARVLVANGSVADERRQELRAKETET